MLGAFAQRCWQTYGSHYDRAKLATASRWAGNKIHNSSMKLPRYLNYPPQPLHAVADRVRFLAIAVAKALAPSP